MKADPKQQRAEANLRSAQKFGRACMGCGKVKKDWSVVRQKRCDQCENKESGKSV